MEAWGDIGLKSMHMIEENLYLGSIDAALNEQKLRSIGITHVLGILDSFSFYKEFDGISYMKIEMANTYQANIIQYLPRVFSFISQAMKSGKVLVHCQMGVARSATFVIAFMMVKYDLNRRQAVEKVRQKRSCVYPNDWFLQQLLTIPINEYKKYLE